MKKVKFKHYRTGEEIIVCGIIKENFNNDQSDYLFLEKDNGRFEAIIKTTILSIEDME